MGIEEMARIHNVSVEVLKTALARMSKTAISASEALRRISKGLRLIRKTNKIPKKSRKSMKAAALENRRYYRNEYSRKTGNEMFKECLQSSKDMYRGKVPKGEHGYSPVVIIAPGG